MRKAIHSYIEQFSKEASAEFGLDEKELIELWHDVVKRRPKKEKKERAPTPYQIFCASQRPLLKKQNPDMSFGDLNRELGRLWKSRPDL